MGAKSIKLEEPMINIGDLVFINHLTKPIKTGWWRKLFYKGNIELYLEIPMHTMFDKDDESLEMSRIKDDVFIMLPSTLSGEPWNKNYEIMFIAKGTATIHLIDNNYIPTMELLNKDNFLYTDRGRTLCEIWDRRNTPQDLVTLANNLVKFN